MRPGAAAPAVPAVEAVGLGQEGVQRPVDLGRAVAYSFRERQAQVLDRRDCGRVKGAMGSR